MSVSFDARLAENYSGLSKKLRMAGEYIAENPLDVATRSLRTVAVDSRLTPATFTRLAKALGYESFEALRESLRSKLQRHVKNFADRAIRLQEEHGQKQTGFFSAHLQACQNNLERLERDIDVDLLSRTVDRLHAARQVLLLGGLGSTGPVEYLSYMANFCTGNWSMASRMGASLGGGLTGLDSRDALVILTKPPFSGRSIQAAELAASQGVFVVVITDTHACPALRHASAGFIVPTESPHFYSSYVATMVLAETLVGMLVSRGGKDARDRIAMVERSNRRLEEVWSG